MPELTQNLPDDIVVGEPENPDSLLNREQIETLVHEKGITPQTRRMIILALVWIATICVIADCALVILAKAGSDALVAISSACAGAIGGMAVPSRNE